MPYAPVSDFHVQAAQVIVRVTDEHKKPLEYDDAAYPGRRLLMWNASEFYVPPGLWGSGVGEDFLRLLTANCTTSLDGCKDVSLMAVKIITERDAAADVRKAGADLMQLYRARGFTEPSPGLRSRLTELNPDTSADGARSERASHRKSHWLVRKAGPPEVDSTRREQSPGARRAQQEGVPSEGEPAH